MKNTLRKRTFISAIAMLLVSAIVLTSSTFAWFSMATRVEVESMDLNITSPDGVQISANTSAFTTTLTLADLKGESTARWNAYEGNINNIPDSLRPSSSRFQIRNALPTFYEGSIDAADVLAIKKVDSEQGSGVLAFDLFVKVGESQKVYWGNSTVECETNPDVLTAMRLALVNCGTVAERSDAGTIQAVLPENYLDNRAVMYEFDSYNHTAESGFAAGETVPDNYMSATSTNAARPAGKNYTEATQLAGATYATKVDQDSAVEDVYFNAAVGVNRIRVYLWMEGNDVDCANDVAGATISFNLVLQLAQDL